MTGLPPQYRERATPAGRLPAFPWDSLAGAKARAAAHPDGMIDLSIGTPVDDVFESARAGLAAASAVPGYPQTAGTPELRAAIAGAMERRHGVVGLSAERGVLPVVGTKEAIAWLPFLLGVGEGHTVVIPELSYPTYEVGARMAGARVVRADSLTQLGPSRPTLMYVNSPGNPSGRVLGVDHLRKVVSWARERGVITILDTVSGLGAEEFSPEAWGIDVAIAGPQKCLSGVPGLALEGVEPPIRRQGPREPDRGVATEGPDLDDPLRPDHPGEEMKELPFRGPHLDRGEAVRLVRAVGAIEGRVVRRVGLGDPLEDVGGAVMCAFA